MCAGSSRPGFCSDIVDFDRKQLSFGSDNRMVIPASALAGASFVIVADTLARTLIAARELPVGAITALIGAPLFIYLLRRG